MKNLLLKLVNADKKYFDLGILLLRVFVCCLMLTHGIAKLSDFGELSDSFADPLGVGSTFSLILILCAEVGCSLLLLIGFMTRLATIPLIFGMLMAFFVIHGGDPFSARELPIVYTSIYVILLITGGGRYSVDEMIRRKLIQ